MGRPASVRPVSCVPVWVNRGSLMSARGLWGGSGVRVWNSLSWQPCSPLLLFVNRCVCLNGSLSVELLHEPMGPDHLSPPPSVLINDSFSAAWEEEERRMMRLAERLEVRGQTALQYTVWKQVHYNQGDWISSRMGGMEMYTDEYSLMHLFACK